MSVHRLTKESLAGINLDGGTTAHKFITTPFRILFGDDEEHHLTLFKFLEIMLREDPELRAREQEFFAQNSMSACGAHDEAQKLAVIDAGLMVVEGIEVPTTVTFSGRSEKYGMGNRQHTQMLGQRALDGEWKLHLAEQSSQ